MDDIFNRFDTIDECDGQTDTCPQLVPRLRIARSKRLRIDGDLEHYADPGIF